MANCSAFLHVCFRFLFVFAIFFVCLPHSSDGKTEYENTLRCALLGKFERKCHLNGPDLSPMFIDLLKKSPTQFRDFLKNPKVDFQSNLVGKVPLSLIYLLPAEVWSQVEPNIAAELVKLHKKNEAIALSVTRGYKSASLSDQSSFLLLVDFNSLESSVVSVMASEITTNWTMDQDTLMSLTPPSFFVSLPEDYILEMERKQQIIILDQIVTWSAFGLTKEKWFDLPALTRRVWATVSKNYTRKADEKKSTTPFLAGATPSEIQQEGKLFSEYELVQLPLKNRLQVRALFPIVRTEDKLTRIDLSLLKNWFHLFSPDQINRFREDIEFMNVIKEKHLEWWTSSVTHKLFGVPSVPTLRQVIEITTLINNERQILPLDPNRWGDDIAMFGPLTYLIGDRRLGKLEHYHKPLQLHTLKEIDSPFFSKRMARHIMFKSQAILKVKGLLRGVSTGHLHNVSESQTGINGMDHLREIVQNIPVDKVPARLAVIFRKIREDLGTFNNLEAILRNPHGGQFFSLLTQEEMVVLYKSFAHHWTRIASENLVDKIPHLPDSVLENVLSSSKKLKLDSGLSAHLEIKALAGLTCDRLIAVDIANVPEMLAAMRHTRKRAGKTDMSKKLQRCARIAVDKYLIERASSTFASRKAVMDSTINAINPVDIENFGGFVLSTFSPNEIVKNPHGKLIMKKIGSLSTYELISAVPCYKCLVNMAETAVKLNNAEKNITFSNLLDLGSLVGFLPASLISSIHPPHWRMMAEAVALDETSQPICGDEASRSSWEGIIRAAFGPPEQWKADTLAAIGGYMPVLLENTLQSVPLDEVAAAGDTMPLTSGAPFLQSVEFIGYDHPRPFWKVCRDLLEGEERKYYETAVQIAARFQLHGAQLFAGTVKSADMLKQQRLSYRPAFKSAPSTESPRDLNKPFTTAKPISRTTTITTTTSTGSVSSKSLLDWWQSKFTRKDTVKELVTPSPSDETKLEISSDLDDFINNSFNVDETVATTQGAVIFSTSESTDSVTEDDYIYDTTNASFEFIQSEQDRMNLDKLPAQTNISSQVVVEGEPENKIDDTMNPADGLNLKLTDFPVNPVVGSTLTPPSKTNGSVHSLIGLSEIQVTQSEENEITTETSSVAGDVTLLVTPKLFIPKMNDSEGGISTSQPFANSEKAQTRMPAIVLNSSYSNSAPKSNESAFSSGSSDDKPTQIKNTTAFSRRRREVDVSASQISLTCDGLLTMGPAAALALSKADVDMPYEEFEDCVEFLGNLELSKEVASAFWKKLNKKSYWNTIEDVGCLVAGMTIEDVDSLDLDIYSDHFLDTITAVSMYADKVVVKAMVLKLNKQLEREVKSKGRVALAEEIVLALGQDICFLPEDSLSHLINTPNVLVRSLSGINRDGFFERSPCQPSCLRSLLNALLNQNKTTDWAAEDSRNAGVLVAGFSEENIRRMSRSTSSKPLGEISAAAVRCLSESQLKVMDKQSLVWWSPLAAGALADQIRVLSAEQKNAINSAIFGRPGVSPAEETVIAYSRGASTTKGDVAALVAIVVPIFYWYFPA